MPKKAPKTKKKLEDFSPLSQRLLKLRDSDKTDWTESSSDSSQPFSASINSSEEKKLLEKLLEYADDRKNHTKILDDILKTLNKLQKESIKTYHTIISKPHADPELKREYLKVSDNIRKINTFLLTEVLNKEYHIYDIKKGSKKFKLISGKYEEKKPRELDKTEYSFF